MEVGREVFRRSGGAKVPATTVTRAAGSTPPSGLAQISSSTLAPSGVRLAQTQRRRQIKADQGTAAENTSYMEFGHDALISQASVAV